MFRKCIVSVVILVAVLVCVAPAQAIERTVIRYNTLCVYGGLSQPIGTNNGTVFYNFSDGSGRQFNVDSKDLYEEGFHLGSNYGKIVGGHWMVTLGFRYTSHEVKDPIVGDGIAVSLPERPTYRQYDVDLNLDYYFMNLRYSTFSPYFGLGIHPGVQADHFKAFKDEYDATFALGLNFGAEVKIYTDRKNGPYLTLASINNWNFLATSDRPRHLNIGGGLRYYFR